MHGHGRRKREEHGLGLAIARANVERYHGTISLMEWRERRKPRSPFATDCESRSPVDAPSGRVRMYAIQNADGIDRNASANGDLRVETFNCVDRISDGSRAGLGFLRIAIVSAVARFTNGQIEHEHHLTTVRFCRDDRSEVNPRAA